MQDRHSVPPVGADFHSFVRKSDQRKRLDWHLATMAKERRTGSPSISVDEFERRFERAFGREMTAEERRFLRLANLLLDNHLGIEEEEEIRSKGTAA